MQSTTISTLSPSFTSHSSNNLADVAARVIEEFRHENREVYDDIFNFNDRDYNTNDNNCDANDDDFEFSAVNSSSISDISHGHTSPHHYPLFDTSLLLDIDPDLIKIVDNRSTETDCKPSLVVRIPLRKLFNEEREFTIETDDLAGIKPEMYCVWKPTSKPKTESPEKRNSTGDSSRRWKFRDILYRSKSGGDKTTPFLFFKPLIPTNKKVHSEKVKNVEKTDGVPAVNRRHSFLPSGQALVGALTSVSQSNRNLRPF